MTWEKLPKLNAYHVYRCEVGGKWERLTAKALPVFDRPPKQDKATPIDGRGNWLDKTVKVGGTYQYAITAIDLFGRESQKSDPSPLEVKDVIAPGIPSGLVVEVKDGKMTATWKAPTDVDVVGYHIYRAPTMEDKFEKLNKELVKETQFVDSVTEGGYVYTVSSVDKQGNESSQTVPIWGQFIDQVPPAKITGLAVKAEGGKVTLTWDKAPDKDLDRYVVSRWIGGDWVIVTQGLTETRFEEEVGVHFKEALKYRVHSVDTSHNNGEFAEAESKMPDTLPPAVPSLRQVVPEEKGLKLSWDALDEDAAAFFIERAEAQEGPWTRLAQVKEREYSDATVEAGRTYWYTVIAVDAAGNASGRSNAFSGELADRKPPAKPAGLSGKVDKTMVRLSWTANAEADLDGYVVERKSGDDWEQLGGLRKKAEYVDGSVRIGKYGYRVTAYDKSGNRSDTSDTIEIEVQE